MVHGSCYLHTGLKIPPSRAYVPVGVPGCKVTRFVCKYLNALSLPALLISSWDERATFHTPHDGERI
jgi:hypothetical protein